MKTLKEIRIEKIAIEIDERIYYLFCRLRDLKTNSTLNIISPKKAMQIYNSSICTLLWYCNTYESLTGNKHYLVKRELLNYITKKS